MIKDEISNLGTNSWVRNEKRLFIPKRCWSGVKGCFGMTRMAHGFCPRCMSNLISRDYKRNKKLIKKDNVYKS